MSDVRSVARQKWLNRYGSNSSKKRRRMFQRVAERDRWICQLCGGRVDSSIPRVPNLPDEAGTLDHIVPMSMGGRYRLDNLQLAHRGCNNARGSHV